MSKYDPLEKLTFVTIFYEGDIPLINLQARSLSKFFAADAEILLIYNGSPEALDATTREHLLSLYGPHQDKVRLVEPAELGVTDSGLMGGWRLQQVLKLLSARIAQHEHMIILDSKNHFIDSIGSDDFFDSSGRPKNFFAKKYGIQLTWLRASLAYFGNDLSIATLSVPPTVTPYAVRRQTVLDMLDVIDQREGSVLSLFQKRRFKGTEFYLIFSFLQSGQKDRDFGYFARCPTPATIFSTWPQEDIDIDHVIRRAEDGATKCFGLHRRRERLLPLKFWQRITKLWDYVGITDDEASRFYTERVVAVDDGPLETTGLTPDGP